MVTFAQRLAVVLRDGNLRVADLARWFDRPDPTVRGWVNGGEVGSAPLDAAMIEAVMADLEKRVKRGRGFPVPLLSPSDRIAYLARERAK